MVQLEKPSKRLNVIIRNLRFSASVVGVDWLKENYRMSWRTYTTFLSIFGYLVLTMLTIWNNYDDDWIVLKTTVTMGSACQGISKLFAYLTNTTLIYNMYKVIDDSYVDYEKRSPRYERALDYVVAKTRRGMFSLMVFYIIGYMGGILTPYVCLLVSGSRFLVFELHVPGLDVNTDMGYYSTLALQTVLVICFAFGLFCGDLVAMIYLQQSFMFSSIFAAKVASLNEMLDEPSRGTNAYITTLVKDIALWHQAFSEFTANCDRLFYYSITAQILSAFYTTVVSIFLIVVGAWPGAYTYFTLSIFCLYLYCILGTENEIAIDQFNENIYELHWYDMTVAQQKIVLQVLFKTQNPKTIDVAGVMPLSVTTALRMTKTLYSITMAMIQFLVE